jgi:hypothetical protein
MGEEVRRGAEDRRGGRRFAARLSRVFARLTRAAELACLSMVCASTPVVAQAPVVPPGFVLEMQGLPAGATLLSEGRFDIVHLPTEQRLARALLRDAIARDTFPGLARPVARVTIWVAQDEAMFRAYVGAGAPEWGAAIAFPREQVIVMQGRDAGADAGEPRQTLRHELAHLAVREALGSGIPRWFDEGYASYAAGEWGRDEVLATSFGLVWRGVPTLAGLDSGFYAGPETAQRSYALAHRAVAELATLDPARGLTLLFSHWKAQGSFERGLRLAYGMSSTDFERRWKSRIRRQYGALALAADLSLLSFFLVVLLGPMWWRRRKRQRVRLEAMRMADAAQEERERESALAALLGEVVPEPPDEGRIKES